MSGVADQIRPPIGHAYGYLLEPAAAGTLVTSYYDWSSADPAWKQAGIFPDPLRRRPAGKPRDSRPDHRTRLPWHPA
jgi:hypothetical protein